MDQSNGAMTGRATLPEKIREEAISHTIWHFTGERLLEAGWRSWMGALCAGALATLGGYLRGLPRLGLAMIGLGTFAIVLFIWDMLIARQRAARPRAVEASTAAGDFEKLGEIVLAPGQSLDRWEFRSDNPQNPSMPRFSAPTEYPGGLTMSAPASHHIDLRPEPHHKVCNRLTFQMKLTHDCPESYIYAMVRLTSKDGKTVSKPGWIAFDVGNKPPAKHGPSEWIIYGKPSANGWTAFDISLLEEIRRSCFGQEEGLEFGELLSIRLRGSVSVSPIGLYRAPSA